MSDFRTDDEEQAWLAWRAEGITATDVAEAASGTYGGAYAVVARKLELTPPVEQTPQMARGHRWQARIADAVHALTQFYVVGEEAQWEDELDPRWRATLDGMLARVPEVDTPNDLVGVLEIKTTGKGSWPDRVRWEDQVQWQLMVTGLQMGVIAHVVVDDTDDTFVRLELLTVLADRVRQQYLVSLAEDMWQHMDAGTLPEPDGAAVLPVVKAVHRHALEDEDAASLADLNFTVHQYELIRKTIKELTREKDELEAIIRDRIGAATVGLSDHWRIAVSRPAKVLTAEAEAELLAQRPDLGRSVLDRDRAKVEAPDLYESLREPVGARRMTIKELEGNN
jgi:hypothetical protein